MWMYRHKYYDKAGKRKEKKKSGFKTEKAALKSLLEVKAATIRGDSKQVEHDQLTIGDWLDIWYETNKNSWKVTSRSQREMAIRLHMKPLLGNHKLQKLDRTTYKRDYLNVLEVKYKPSTVKLFHSLFKIAINAAVEDEILSRNRFTKITLSSSKEVQENIENYFTPEELVKLLKSAKYEKNITNYSFLLTVSYTGIRRGEAFGLQWKNIDFDKKTVTIERTRDNKGVRSPKTKNSYRTILIDDLLLNQLKEYRKWCRETMLSFGYKITDDSYVFISHQTGKPSTDNTILYAFRRLLNKTGISYIWFILFSSVIATVSIIKNSPAIVIGAMVIAPIIGPETAISFASVLGDFKLIRQSLLTSLFGIGVPILIATILSFFFVPSLYSNEWICPHSATLFPLINFHQRIMIH